MRAEQDLDQLCDAVRQHADDLLLCIVAFDGVLSEYESDPAHVMVSPSRRARLKAFAQTPGVRVALISGRRVADLRSRADIGPDAFYIGLHGMEAVGPGFVRVDRDSFDRHRDRIRRIAAKLEPVVAEVAGARLEEKEAALALHTRDIDPGDAVWIRFQLLNAAADLVNSNEVRALRGHDVLELLPNVAHPRASAIGDLQRFVADLAARSVFTLYIGPDVADDDALDAVRPNGVAAVVGRRGHDRYHLASTADVERLLDRLEADLARPRRERPPG
jgi:trehalose-phosphatase